MCGVFGYVGEPTDLGDQLVTALRTLEYRGYDSWGIAIGLDGRIAVEKRVGRLNGDRPRLPESGIGFGHTRWATHGGVTEPNAHPHLDCGGTIAVIHNGIVDNHRALRDALRARGHRFASETDSEVIAHLLEEEMTRDGDLAAALARVFPLLEGLNAVVAMDVRSQELVAAKSVSPLVAGLGPRGAVIASDALALRPHADRVVYLEDNQLIRLRRDGLALFDRATLGPIRPTFSTIDRSTRDAELGDYPHFMAKEIAEQPAVLERLVRQGRDEIEALAAEVVAAPVTHLVGCGTAGFAALSGAYLFGQIASRRVDAIVGSEFAFRVQIPEPGCLVVGLSQSGETADLIEAMLIARRHGARLGALVNVEHSTLDRLVDRRVALRAGPEQCVLATKSYTAKIAALLLLAHAAVGRYDEGRDLVCRAADGLARLLSGDHVARMRELAAMIAGTEHVFVVGRGLAYPTALEAALKIKEVSYVHAEGIAGGELKHGVIALISSGTPCLVYAPNDSTRADAISGATELKSRGAFIVGIGPEPDPIFDVHLQTPDVGPAAPIVNALPPQQLGYHAALLRGNDPDRPRNLAKSVTVK